MGRRARSQVRARAKGGRIVSNPERVKPDGLYCLRDWAPGLPWPEWRAKPNGEYRPPRAGEWYLSGSVVEAYRARTDMNPPYHIARLVRVEVIPATVREVPAAVCPHCGQPADGSEPNRYCLGCYWQEDSASGLSRPFVNGSGFLPFDPEAGPA